MIITFLLDWRLRCSFLIKEKYTVLNLELAKIVFVSMFRKRNWKI